MENNLRPVRNQICKQCGNAFLAQRRDARYCCNACRQMSYLVRAAEKNVRQQIAEYEGRYKILFARGKLAPKHWVDLLTDDVFNMTKGWWYKRLPSNSSLVKYVEEVLWVKVSKLKAQSA